MRNVGLFDAINERIYVAPERKVLTVKEKTYTYADVGNRIELWESELECHGVFRRCKVAVFVKEPIDIVGIYFALCKLDCIVIPIDISAGQHTVSKIIESAKVHCVISLETLEQITYQKRTSLWNGYVLYWTHYKDNDVEDDIMQFLYTSGTTGLPKCVMFSKESIASNIIGLADKLQLTEKDVLYTPVSLMLPAVLHTILLPALLSGSRVYVSDTTVPGGVLQNIVRQGVTVFFAVPFFYKLLAEHSMCKENTWKNVRLCLTSSAYLSEDDFIHFYKKSLKGLHSIYCSSEAGTIAYNASENIADLCKFVGKPLPGCRVSLMQVNAEGFGEIIVQGSMVSTKYYENNMLNKKVYCNGWVRTGDIGRIHANGYLEIKGRASESFNVGGHLVSPLEVEQTVMKHEKVKDAVAYKYMDNAKNDMIGIKVVVRKGASLEEQEIIHYCASMLPSYKVPKKVQIVDKIDVGRYGKKKRGT